MNEQESVTAVVTRRIVPGRKPDYRDWVHQVDNVARRFPGYQGLTLKEPGEQGEYHVVYRFDTIEHLRDWEKSAERREWIAKLEGIVEGEERMHRLTGLEFLFANQLHPKAHKMALVLSVAIFTMQLVLTPLYTFLFNALPAIPDWGGLLFRVVFQVMLLTYVVMPPVTRYLTPWLAR